MKFAAATTKLLALAAIGGALFWIAPVRAESITIDLAEDGFDGGNGVGQYVQKAISPSNPSDPKYGSASVNTGYGTFSFNTISAFGATVLGGYDLLFSNVIDTSSSVAGTHTLYIKITETGIASPGPGVLDASSGFTTNLLKNGFTVTETTYLNGQQLDSASFTHLGGTTLDNSGNVSNSFSIEELYAITANGKGSAGSSITVSGSVSVSQGNAFETPLPAALPMFAGAIAGGLVLRNINNRRRRRA